MFNRRLLAIVSLVAASALCALLVEVRTRETGDPYYRFLVWNLTLAWAPLLLAIAAYVTARRRVGVLVALFLTLWLLFFPNAPYLLTDFIHLEEGPAPLWYDALMLSAFAWTGLVLGFASLYLVQIVLRPILGSGLAWLAVLLSLGLASLGVYIGRFVRFNSWDALLHPRLVIGVVREQLANVPLLMAEGLLALTSFLAIAYLLVYSFAGLHLEPDQEANTDRPSQESRRLG